MHYIYNVTRFQIYGRIRCDCNPISLSENKWEAFEGSATRVKELIVCNGLLDKLIMAKHQACLSLKCVGFMLLCNRRMLSTNSSRFWCIAFRKSFCITMIAGGCEEQLWSEINHIQEQANISHQHIRANTLKRALCAIFH